MLQATKLDPISKKLTLDSGAEISYDKCLLATGGKPKNLPIFSEAPPPVQEKVSLYRSIPDYQKLDELVGSVGSILVVGGGFLGSELAVGMANRGKSQEPVPARRTRTTSVSDGSTVHEDTIQGTSGTNFYFDHSFEFFFVTVY